MLVSLLALAGCAGEAGGPARGADAAPVPVAVAPVVVTRIAQSVVFSGTLEARGVQVVASRVDGQLVRLSVDIGDTVTSGQEVGRLEDGEAVSAVAQAAAAREAAQAAVVEAESALQIATRERARVATLREQGAASVGADEAAEAAVLTRSAALEVATARVAQAAAALTTARTRLDYTRLRAGWSTGEVRVVGARHAQEGQLVSTNDPILTLVGLDPLVAVISVTEADYGALQAGQAATVQVDALPGQTFPAAVDRIAPIFDPASRMARVELSVPNAEGRLKPGMFATISLELAASTEATVVPAAAVVTRAGQAGVFLATNAAAAAWRPVVVGLRQGEQVQVQGEGIAGQVVVVLGQADLEDGSPLVVIAPEDGL